MIAPRHARNGGSVRSLADASPGDLVRVQLIVFEFARTSCWDLGIRRGEVLRCVGTGDDGVRVVRKDGSDLRVPAECARFVAISSADEEVPARESTVGRS